MSKVIPIKNKDDVIKLLRFLKRDNYRNFVLVYSGIHLGIRIGDLLKLKVGDVKNKKIIEITEEKTGKYLKREIHKDLIPVYKEFCCDKEEEEYLFKSRQQGNRAITEVQAWRIIKKAVKYAGLDGKIGTHSLRKTYAWNIYIESQRDLEKVRVALNHSHTGITKAYLNMESEEVDKIGRKVTYKI